MVSGGVWWCLVVSGSVGVCKLVLPELIDVYGQICLNVSRRLSPSLAVSHRLSPFLTVSHRFSPFLTVSHRFSPFPIISHRFSLLLTTSHRFSLFLSVSHCFSEFVIVSQLYSFFLTISHRLSPFFTFSHCFSHFFTVSHHGSRCCWPWWMGPFVWWARGTGGPWVWLWACGSGGFCGVLTDKSPILRGPTCQGVLGLVFSVLD